MVLATEGTLATIPLRVMSQNQSHDKKSTTNKDVLFPGNTDFPVIVVVTNHEAVSQVAQNIPHINLNGRRVNGIMMQNYIFASSHLTYSFLILIFFLLPVPYVYCNHLFLTAAQTTVRHKLFSVFPKYFHSSISE